MYLLSSNEGTWERASGENSGASEPIGGDILVHDWEVRDGPNSTEHTQRESERDKPDGGVSLHDDPTAKKKRERCFEGGDGKTILPVVFIRVSLYASRRKGSRTPRHIRVVVQPPSVKIGTLSLGTGGISDLGETIACGEKEVRCHGRG